MKLNPAPSSLDKPDFVGTYGHVYELSPWIAEQTWDQTLTTKQDTVLGLSEAMEITLNAASNDEKLGLIRAHPDLAGRAAIAKTLTADSNAEQASAGIDQCSPEEYRRFVDLNEQYKRKFGFPFVMAVRGSNRHQILQAFGARLNNNRSDEFETALQEINKIARLRLEQMAQQ